MADPIPRQYHPDYTFFPDYFCHPIPAASSDSSTGQFMFNCNAAAINTMPFMGGSDMNSPVSVTSFPQEQFGVPDCTTVPVVSEWEMGFRRFPGFNYKNGQAFEPRGDYCNRPSTGRNLWPDYRMPADDWVIQGKPVVKVEESEVKVGRYSVEERKDRILRYLKKRNQRNFNKTIKYACRKTLADKRVRVRGRFAKNSEPSGDQGNEMKTNTNHDSYQQSNNSFFDDSLQMMYKDEDWFRAAMAAGLAYFPYSAG